MKYTIRYEKTILQVSFIQIEANSEEEALNKADKLGNMPPVAEEEVSMDTFIHEDAEENETDITNHERSYSDIFRDGMDH